MNITFWLFLIVFIPFLWVIFARKRGKELVSLANNGRKVKATVVDKKYRRNSKSGSTTYKIQYIFSTKLDEKISKTVNVSSEFYENNDIGSEVNVFYLPDHPEISALAYLVELVASAMKNKQKTIN